MSLLSHLCRRIFSTDLTAPLFNSADETHARYFNQPWYRAVILVQIVLIPSFIVYAAVFPSIRPHAVAYLASTLGIDPSQIQSVLFRAADFTSVVALSAWLFVAWLRYLIRRDQHVDFAPDPLESILVPMPPVMAFRTWLLMTMESVFVLASSVYYVLYAAMILLNTLEAYLIPAPLRLFPFGLCIVTSTAGLLRLLWPAGVWPQSGSGRQTK